MPQGSVCVEGEVGGGGGGGENEAKHMECVTSRKWESPFWNHCVVVQLVTRGFLVNDWR